jgi:hypothetical protein
VFRILVRRGGLDDGSGMFFPEGTNLSVLESAPLLGALVTLPTTIVLRLKRRYPLLSGVRPTDALAAVYALLFVTLYFPTLPIHLQVTVRYLTPLYPLGVYAVVRQSALRRAITTRVRSFAAATVGTVVVGMPALAYGTAHLGLGKGGAFQFHAGVGLVAAGLLALAAIGSLFDERADRATAGLFGVTVGLGVVLVVLSAVVYMHYAHAALPLVREIGGWLRFELLRLTVG